MRSVSERRYERLGEWFNPSLNYIKYVLGIIAYIIFLDHILLGFGRRLIIIYLGTITRRGFSFDLFSTRFLFPAFPVDRSKRIVDL